MKSVAGAVFAYARKTFFRRKRLAVFSVLGLTLSITIIVCVLNTAISVSSSADEYLARHYGEYDVIIGVNGENEGQTVKNDARLSDVCFIKTVGSVKIDGSLLDGRATAAYVELGVFDMSGYTVISGELPDSPGEGAIEKSIAEKLSLSDMLSRKVRVTTSDGEEIEFVLTAILSDFYAYQRPSDTSPAFWPAVLLFDGDGADGATYAIAHMKEYTDDSVLGLTEDYKPSFFLSQRLNTESTVATISDSNRIILLILAVSATLIGIMSTVSSSVLDAAVTGRQLSELKILGAGVDGVYLFGMFSFGLKYLLSLIPGVAAGILASYVISETVIEGFLGFYTFTVFPSAVAAGAFIPFLIPALFTLARCRKAARTKPLTEQEKEYSGLKRTTRIRFRDMFLKWSYLYMRNNRGVYIGVTAAMIFCYLILSFGGFFGYTITDQYSELYSDTYRVSCADGYSFSDFFIPLKPYYGIDDADIAKLAGNGEIESISAIKSLNVLLNVEAGSETDSRFHGSTVRENARSEDGYLTAAGQIGFGGNDNVYMRQLYGCDGATIAILLKDIAVDTAKLRDGTGVVAVCKAAGQCPYNVGDKVNLTQMIVKDGDTDISNADRLTASPTLLAVVVPSGDEMKNRFPTSTLYSDDFALVWENDSFASFGFPLRTSKLFINLSDLSAYEETEAVLDSFRYVYPDALILSERENSSMKNSLLNTLSLSVSMITLFIFGMCMAAVINTVRLKFITRRSLWGTLRAMGASRSFALKQQLFDVSVMFGTAVLTAGAACALFDLIKRTMTFRQDMMFFNGTMLAGCCVSVILCFIIVFPIGAGMFRENITDQLEQKE